MEKNSIINLAHVLAVCLILLLVAGCSEQPTAEEHKKAFSWCDNFGGTKVVTFNSINGLRARCNDGTLIVRDALSN